MNQKVNYIVVNDEGRECAIIDATASVHNFDKLLLEVIVNDLGVAKNVVKIKDTHSQKVENGFRYIHNVHVQFDDEVSVYNYRVSPLKVYG